MLLPSCREGTGGPSLPDNQTAFLQAKSLLIALPRVNWWPLYLLEGNQEVFCITTLIRSRKATVLGVPWADDGGVRREQGVKGPVVTPVGPGDQH